MRHKGRTVLVFGSTGRQGGAVARRLLSADWRVRAFTRDTGKPEARALADLGADLVKGSLDDAGAIDKAMKGVYGVFSVQDSWSAGVDGEIRQGKVVADLAKEHGVKHLVYTSVGGAERKTGIPHFDSKFAIEEHIRELDLPATILRPVFFMDNFSSPDIRLEILRGTLTLPMRPDRSLQMIAVDDIGGLAYLAFEDPDRYIGRSYEIAGDELTMVRAAEILSRVLGRTVRYVEKPIEEVRRHSTDVALMFEWFNDPTQGYHCDIRALWGIYPELKTFEQWLRSTSWGRVQEAVGATPER